MIKLVPCKVEHAAALIEGDESFLSKFGWEVKEGYLEFPETLIWMWGELAEGAMKEPWTTYLVLQEDEAALVGMAGFKSPPKDRSVEIGYGTARAYRGKGIATEVTRQLVEIAAATGEVDVVEATTLPDANPSTGVLLKNGFNFVGTTIDPDEGAVFLWKRLLHEFA